jgi:hypothetical protein
VYRGDWSLRSVMNITPKIYVWKRIPSWQGSRVGGHHSLGMKVDAGLHMAYPDVSLWPPAGQVVDT